MGRKNLAPEFSLFVCLFIFVMDKEYGEEGQEGGRMKT